MDDDYKSRPFSIQPSPQAKSAPPVIYPVLWDLPDAPRLHDYVDRFLTKQPAVWAAWCKFRELTIPRHARLFYQLSERYIYWYQRQDLNQKLGRKKRRKKVMLDQRASNYFKRLPRHKYQPIKHEIEFRCLDILEGSGNDPLVAKLVVVSFGGVPDYDCISYRFDYKRPHIPLELDGGRFYVTEHVAAMLRNVRTPDKPRRVWLDTVCIDQTNEVEKIEQIGRMGWIYCGAIRTVVWLGDEVETTADAHSLFTELAKVVEDLSSDERTLCRRRGDMFALTLPAMPSYDDPRWPAFANFMQNSWYTRTWIQQEIALAREPYLQIGSTTFSWKLMTYVVNLLRSPVVQARINCYPRAAERIVDLFVMLWSHPRVTVLAILLYTWTTQTSVAKDKVFGVFGLGADRGAIQALVDYRMDAETVFRKIAFHYISGGNIEILNYAHDSGLRNIRSMPTWVPDWTKGGCGQSIISYWKDLNSSASLGTDFPKPKKLPTCTDDGMTLILSGLIIDTVRLCGRVATPLNWDLNDVGSARAWKFYQSWRYLSHSCDPYPTGEPIADAFKRTLTVDMKEYSDDDRKTDAKDDADQDSTSGKQDNGVYDPDRPFHDPSRDATVRRTFFTTKHGYIGLGPYFVRPGDLIARFDSGKSPFVLRQAKGGCYRLVGDAYIRGMMRFDDDNTTFEDLRLR